MFQLLIAEDEKIERDYLESMIKQSQLPIRSIYTAKNGAEAVEICQQQDIDILLLDIEMPVKNGLEALKEIRAFEKTQSICFVLTSYSSFYYAQEAIRLRVEDFILKPSSPEQIMERLISACNRLSVQRNKQLQMNALVNKMNHIFPVLETQCARAILLGKSEIDIQKQLKLQNIFMKSGICFLFDEEQHADDVFTIKQAVEEKGFSCLYMNFNHDEILFIIANYDMHEDDVQKLYAFIKQYAPCYYGSLQQETSKLQQSYKEALEMKKHEHKLPIPQVDETIEQTIQTLLEEYDTNQMNALRCKLEQCIQTFFYQLQYDQEKRKDFFLNFLTTLIEAFERHDDTILYQKPSFQHDITDIDIHHYAMDFVDYLVDRKYQRLDYITKEVLRYVQQNYRNQISLQDVADELKVSPTYISRMLNKQVGKPFTEIINEYRIQDAKQLIKQDYPLKKIAFETGFRSQSYFTQIFKKVVGMSPKDYRNLYERE